MQTLLSQDLLLYLGYGWMAKAPTKAQRRRWDRVRGLGCVFHSGACRGPVAIHHAGTGSGGRKDHDKVIPLCWEHHQGKEGIHTLSRRIWAEKFGVTEAQLLSEIEARLAHFGNQ